MVIILLLLAFMVITTVLVIAAGVMSSRMSQTDEWVEVYEPTSAEAPNGVPQSLD